MARLIKENLAVISALEQDILSVLDNRYTSRELYGLEILRFINDARKQFKMPELTYGSFYPTMGKLQKQGLIDSKWGNNATEGARRRYYQITDNGQAALELIEDYRKRMIINQYLEQ